VFAGSILKPGPLKHTIARLVPATRFADMQIPSRSRRRTSTRRAGAVRRAGPRRALIDVLYASCALPLYLPPQTIGGRRLGEGGLRAVLGLDVARRVPADLVVAVDVGPGFDEPPARSRRPSRRWCGRTARRSRDDGAQTERAIAAWPKDAPKLIVVRAVAEREATFDVSSGQRFFDAGYRNERASADHYNHARREI